MTTLHLAAEPTTRYRADNGDELTLWPDGTAVYTTILDTHRAGFTLPRMALADLFATRTIRDQSEGVHPTGEARAHPSHMDAQRNRLQREPRDDQGDGVGPTLSPRYDTAAVMREVAAMAAVEIMDRAR